MPGILNSQNAWDDFSPLNSSQWEEWVGDDGHREDTVTNGESLCTLRGYVLDHELIVPALTYFLGYSWVDSNLICRRRLPVCHPENNQLFAKRVSIKGWKYKRKEQLAVLRARNANPLSGSRLPFAIYEKYLFEIDFQMMPYKVLPDGFSLPGRQMTEWDRFTTSDPDDNTEIIAVDGGSYRYKTGTQAGKPVTISGPMIKKTVERTRLKVTVHNLPYDLIYNEYDIPVKIMKMKGKVNKLPFRGQAGQTMLLESFKPIKYPQAVATQTWTVLQFGVDMEFIFNYQEPAKASATESLAGWNLVPGINNRWDAGWVGIETPAGDAMFQQMDLNALITHWSLNDYL